MEEAERTLVAPWLEGHGNRVDFTLLNRVLHGRRSLKGIFEFYYHSHVCLTEISTHARFIDMHAASADHLASWKLFIDELERKILPFYREHEQKFDSYGVHGRMHICRSVMVAEWMARFYHARTPVDFFAVRAATAFHDSGRRANGVDLWESDSAANCVRYIVESGGAMDYADAVGALIEKKKPSADPLKKIVQDADVLEIMRPCCGHGGLAGFRRQFLHFGGPDDVLTREVPGIAEQREALVQEAWRWIQSTEPLKAFLADSPAYMRDLLKHLERKRSEFPLVSELL